MNCSDVQTLQVQSHFNCKSVAGVSMFVLCLSYVSGYINSLQSGTTLPQGQFYYYYTKWTVFTLADTLNAHYLKDYSLLTPISPLPCFSSRSSMWELAGGTFSGRALAAAPRPSLWSNSRGRQLMGDLHVEEESQTEKLLQAWSFSKLELLEIYLLYARTWPYVSLGRFRLSKAAKFYFKRAGVEIYASAYCDMAFIQCPLPKCKRPTVTHVY